MNAWLRAIALAIVILPPAALADTAPAPLVPVRVAITPVYYGAIPILYAIKTGMFVKAGLDVQLSQLPTGSAITAAVAGGSIDIGKSSFSPVVSAFARGVPITLIAPGVVYDAKAPNGALLVLKSSSIRGPANLPGKTVAVSNLNDPTRPATLSWLVQNHADPQGVKFFEIPTTAMLPALEDHRVDSIILTSPYMDEAIAGGKVRPVGYIMNAIAPRFLFDAYFSSKSWAAEHRDAARRFADVIVAAAAYTNAHRVELAPTIAELLSAPLTVIQHMTWPTGGTTLNPAEMQPVIDIGVKYGLLPARFSAADMIFDFGPK